LDKQYAKSKLKKLGKTFGQHNVLMRGAGARRENSSMGDYIFVLSVSYPNVEELSEDERKQLIELLSKH
jgi:hypothetical protein